MGLIPDHWGPYVWGAIHLICLGAPDKLDSVQQQAYKSFFEQLPYVLPCSSCAEHLQQNLGKVPITSSLATRDELFAWSVRLHNLVNSQLQKPQLSLEQARDHWDRICRGAKEKGCEDHTQGAYAESSGVKWMFIYFFVATFFMALGYLLGKSRKGLRTRS